MLIILASIILYALFAGLLWHLWNEFASDFCNQFFNIRLSELSYTHIVTILNKGMPAWKVLGFALTYCIIRVIIILSIPVLLAVDARMSQGLIPPAAYPYWLSLVQMFGDRWDLTVLSFMVVTMVILHFLPDRFGREVANMVIVSNRHSELLFRSIFNPALTRLMLIRRLFNIYGEIDPEGIGGSHTNVRDSSHRMLADYISRKFRTRDIRKVYEEYIALGSSKADDLSGTNPKYQMVYKMVGEYGVMQVLNSLISADRRDEIREDTNVSIEMNCTVGGENITIEGWIEDYGYFHNNGKIKSIKVVIPAADIQANFVSAIKRKIGGKKTRNVKVKCKDRRLEQNRVELGLQIEENSIKKFNRIFKHVRLQRL